MDTPMKVAIIGSGIAGLSLAYFLSHPEQNGRFEVTIYESHHRLGLDSQSICFEGDGYADGSFEDDMTERIDGCPEPHFVSWKNNSNHANHANNSNNSNNSNQQPSHQQNNDKKPRVRIDMPLRVFSTRYYPHLTSLLESIGVKYRAENYEASFCQYNGAPIFQYQNFVLGKFSIPYVNPKTLFDPVTRDVIRFLHCAPQDLRSGRLLPPPGLVTTFDLLSDVPLEQVNIYDILSTATNTPLQNNCHDGSNGGDSNNGNQKNEKNEKNEKKPYRAETLLEYLQAEGYSDEFIYHFEIPTVASICTCSYEAAANYPAYIIIQYQTLRSGNGVRRVASGANKVVTGLSQYITHIKCNSAVVGVNYLPGGKLCGFDGKLCANCVEFSKQNLSSPLDTIDCDTNLSKSSQCLEPRVEITDSNGNKEIFHHIVFASQANQTCKILTESLFSNKFQTPRKKSNKNTQQNNLACNLALQKLQDGEGHRDCIINKTTPESTTELSPPPAIPQNWYDFYETLSRIPYESSELILHGDERFLPQNKEHWCNVNFLIPDLNTVKQFVHNPPNMIPNIDTNSNSTNTPRTTTNLGASLLPTTQVLIPESLCSPIPNDIATISDQSSLIATTTTTTTTTLSTNPLKTQDLSTLLTKPSLTQQFSQDWLTTISRQPSAHAQREALVMDAKIVSQNEGMSTIWMNRVQNGIQSDCNIFQTWNPYVGIISYGDNDGNNQQMTKECNQNENLIKQVKNLYGRSFFQRPIVTFDSIEACKKLWMLNGKANIWSIGSFSLGGVPLLESGVASAFIISKKLGARTVIVFPESVKESTKFVQIDCNGTKLIEQNGINFEKKTNQTLPILGWVNSATKTNTFMELIIGVIYYILFYFGAYNDNYKYNYKPKQD